MAFSSPIDLLLGDPSSPSAVQLEEIKKRKRQLLSKVNTRKKVAKLGTEVNQDPARKVTKAGKPNRLSPQQTTCQFCNHLLRFLLGCNTA